MAKFWKYSGRMDKFWRCKRLFFLHYKFYLTVKYYAVVLNAFEKYRDKNPYQKLPENQKNTGFFRDKSLLLIGAECLLPPHTHTGDISNTFLC